MLEEIINEEDYLSPWQKKGENDNKAKIEKIYSNISTFIDKDGSKVYKEKCQSCHGVVREGVYEGETAGDLYIQFKFSRVL